MQYRENVLLWPKSDERKKSLVLFYLFTLWFTSQTRHQNMSRQSRHVVSLGLICRTLRDCQPSRQDPLHLDKGFWTEGQLLLYEHSRFCHRAKKINKLDILFHSNIFYSIPYYSILFYSDLFHSVLLNSFYYILFFSILFYSILFYSILFYSILFIESSSPHTVQRVYRLTDCALEQH